MRWLSPNATPSTRFVTVVPSVMVRIEQAKASGGSNCKLAVAYALESVEATRKRKGGVGSQVAVALTKKLLCRQ
jgi:hypothetical protein